MIGPSALRFCRKGRATYEPANIRPWIRFRSLARLASGELFKRGIRINLQEQPLAVLTMLLERAGEVDTRKNLRHRFDRTERSRLDRGLNTAVNRLRETLGDPQAIRSLLRPYRVEATALSL